MRILGLAALAVSVATIAAGSAYAEVSHRPHRLHHRHYVRTHDGARYRSGVYGNGYGYGYGPSDPYSVPGYPPGGRVPVGTYGEPVPFRTVQPTDVGIGALAPNGYRGPGTASGGPAGGLNNGGGR